MENRLTEAILSKLPRGRAIRWKNPDRENAEDHSHQVVPEPPHRAVVRSPLRVPEEPLEAQPVIQALPPLGVVCVHGLYDGSEPLPVYLFLGIDESAAAGRSGLRLPYGGVIDGRCDIGK